MFSRRAISFARSDHALVVRGNRRVIAVQQQLLHQPRVVGVHGRFVGVRHSRRLQVRALAQTHAARPARSPARRPPRCGTGTPAARCRRCESRRPTAPGARPACAAVYADDSMSMRTKVSSSRARSRILRRLATHSSRDRSSPSWVNFSETLPSTSSLAMRLDRLEVGAHRALRLGGVGHALAQVVQADQQPLGIQRLRRRRCRRPALRPPRSAAPALARGRGA